MRENIWKNIKLGFKTNKLAVAGAAAIILLALISIFAFLYPVDPNAISATERLNAPSMAHLFGTDDMGRDYLARCIYGGRASLLVGFLSMVLSTALGVIIGSISGFVGGTVDAVLTFANASQYIRYLRSSTITEMSSDYVMVQKAYGMKESGILFRHVLKNAMLPMITVLGMSLQSLVSGAIITEQVFAWPGIGQLAVTAVMQYDYPLIMGITMFTALLVVLGNLLADVLYAVFDPRIRKAGC